MKTPNGELSWLPYSIGCLWSYVSADNEIDKNFQLGELFYRRDPIQTVIERIDAPVVCGFSCYVWNEQWCLAAAQEIKRQWPDCFIVFGGPQAHVSYLEKYSFVDSVISGEGEESFLELLKSILANSTIKKIYDTKRIDNLNLPSPWLTGVFDRIIDENPTTNWQTTWETNRGCPYACTFCDWGSTTNSKIKKFDLSQLQQELDWMASRPITSVFVADANFGIFKERDIEIAQMIKQASSHSRLKSLNVQFAKNSNETIFEIAKILGNLIPAVTLSMQSMNNDTLDAIKRTNLASNNIKQLIKLGKNNNINSYTELILGLPLETLESWKEGVANLLEMGQHDYLSIWLGQMLANSELSSPESREKYKIGTVFTEKDYSASETGQVNEYIEIVNRTSTMPIDDMTDSYMYSWLVTRLHSVGYTQIHAKYCRTIHGISYRQYYDRVLQMILEDPASILCQQYTQIRYIFNYFLHHGSTPTAHRRSGDAGLGIVGGNAFNDLMPIFYENRSNLYDFAYRVTESLIGWCPNDVDLLQRSYLLSVETQSPYKIDLSFDPVKWQPTPCSIVLTHNNIESILTNTTEIEITAKVERLHRNSLLKNNIEAVPQKTMIPIRLIHQG
jgi:putative methyltransferase